MPAHRTYLGSHESPLLKEFSENSNHKSRLWTSHVENASAQTQKTDNKNGWGAGPVTRFAECCLPSTQETLGWIPRTPQTRPVTAALGRCRQEDLMFKVILKLHSKLKASLGYISEPITKKKKIDNNKKLLKSSRKGTRTTTNIKIPLPRESYWKLIQTMQATSQIILAILLKLAKTVVPELMVNINLISPENELDSVCLQPAHEGSSGTQLCSHAH